MIIKNPKIIFSPATKVVGNDLVADAEKVVKMISFELDGKQFQAEEGMTWREWIVSEYNTGPRITNAYFSLDGGSLIAIYYDDPNGFQPEYGYLADVYVSCKADDVIESNVYVCINS